MFASSLSSGGGSSDRDRTAEFFQLVRRHEKSTGLEGTEGSNGFTKIDHHQPLLSEGASNSNNNGATSAIATKTQFTQAAAHIGRGIFGIATKLEHLTKLAQKRSLYEDKSNEINEVTYVIKNDLDTLNRELDMLHHFVEERSSGSHSSANSEVIVSGLKQKLADTTKQFAGVLQTRTKTMKEQNVRRKNFETTGPRLPKRNIRSFGQRMGDSSSPSNSGEVDLEGGHGEGFTLQENQQLMMNAPQEDTYLDSRAQAVENIEKTIGELGSMYQKLINIVDMQRDITIRIDENVDNTLTNVEAGHNQLVKHLNSLSSNQWLIMKIFMILIVFAVFFTVFVA